MIRRRDLWIVPALLTPGCRRSQDSIAGIRFQIRKNGNSPRRLLHIHGDETTARDVLNRSLQDHPGTAFFVESDTREVSIGKLLIDPNRMFSREGAEESLKNLNPNALEGEIQAALAQLDQERNQFLDKILPPAGGLLIALHNNSRGYSMNDELAISDRYTFKKWDEPYDFVLTSSLFDFDLLDRSPFNCVLQQNPPPPDDGSLSRLCSARSIRYINIEAALGNETGQQEILNWVLENIPPEQSS